MLDFLEKYQTAIAWTIGIIGTGLFVAFVIGACSAIAS